MRNGVSIFPNRSAIWMCRKRFRRSRIVLTPKGELHWQAYEAFDPRGCWRPQSQVLYQLDVGARASGAQPLHIQLIDPLLRGGSVNTTSGGATAHSAEALNQAAADLIPEFLKTWHGHTGRQLGGLRGLGALCAESLHRPAQLIPKLEATQVPLRPIPSRALLRVQATLSLQPLAQSSQKRANSSLPPWVFTTKAPHGDVRSPGAAPGSTIHRRAAWRARPGLAAVITARCGRWSPKSPSINPRCGHESQQMGGGGS